MDSLSEAQVENDQRTVIAMQAEAISKLQFKLEQQKERFDDMNRERAFAEATLEMYKFELGQLHDESVNCNAFPSLEKKQLDKLSKKCIRLYDLNNELKMEIAELKEENYKLKDDTLDIQVDLENQESPPEDAKMDRFAQELEKLRTNWTILEREKAAMFRKLRNPDLEKSTMEATIRRLEKENRSFQHSTNSAANYSGHASAWANQSVQLQAESSKSAKLESQLQALILEHSKCSSKKLNIVVKEQKELIDTLRTKLEGFESLWNETLERAEREKEHAQKLETQHKIMVRRLAVAENSSKKIQSFSTAL